MQTPTTCRCFINELSIGPCTGKKQSVLCVAVARAIRGSCSPGDNCWCAFLVRLVVCCLSYELLTDQSRIAVCRQAQLWMLIDISMTQWVWVQLEQNKVVSGGIPTLDKSFVSVRGTRGLRLSLAPVRSFHCITIDRYATGSHPAKAGIHSAETTTMTKGVEYSAVGQVVRGVSRPVSHFAVRPGYGP